MKKETTIVPDYVMEKRGSHITRAISYRNHVNGPEEIAEHTLYGISLRGIVRNALANENARRAISEEWGIE